MKIIVGMSGGVDSSMAALLLRDEGHEIIGVTLDVWPARCVTLREDICCGPKGIEAAQEVAGQLGIAHRVVDVRNEFMKRTVTYFISEYRKGRTPNPCVMCNAAVKFPALLRTAGETGCHAVATGHYARVARRDGRFLLMRGEDRSKDQAYFLSRLSQDVLGRVIFPLGARRKDEIRALASEKALRTHARPESQEICFIPDSDYRSFLNEACGDSITPGDIIDKRGRVIGRHPGIEFFTVGQRCGLYLRSNVRQYVIAIDPERRTLTVGGPDDLVRNDCVISDINWIAFEIPPDSLRATVKIRYNHPGVMSTVRTQAGGAAIAEFDEPQKAVTPGQAAVFYDGDTVIGGGWIA